MEKNFRKWVGVYFAASLIGLALALCSLLLSEKSGTWDWVTDLVFAGLFCINSIRYGIRWQQARKAQNG